MPSKPRPKKKRASRKPTQKNPVPVVRDAAYMGSRDHGTQYGGAPFSDFALPCGCPIQFGPDAQVCDHECHRAWKFIYEESSA